jgi:hypothetical protein
MGQDRHQPRPDEDPRPARSRGSGVRVFRRTLRSPALDVACYRTMLFATEPASIGIERHSETLDVWGTLMEFQVSGTVVSPVAPADGTTGMYFSNGGGLIGAGQDPNVSGASQGFVAPAEHFRNEMQRVTGSRNLTRSRRHCGYTDDDATRNTARCTSGLG